MTDRRDWYTIKNAKSPAPIRQIARFLAGDHRRGAGVGEPRCLSQQLCDDLASHIGQPILPPLKLKRQLSWSRPKRCRSVAWKSLMCTGSSTIV